MTALARSAPLRRTATPITLRLAQPSVAWPAHRDAGQGLALAPPATMIVVPARWGSSRFPGKPLALLHGAHGTARTLLERTWRTAQAAARLLPGPAEVVIATDDRRIARAARDFGAEVAMTPAACRNGTERCAALLADAGMLSECSTDLVVNLQGDAPLVPTALVAALVARMVAEPALAAVTVGLPLPAAAPGASPATQVLLDAAGDALGFWREGDPLLATDHATGVEAWRRYRHLGVYAYRPSALAAYAALPPAQAELRDGLEPWRFLCAGLRLGVVIGAPPPWDPVECNVPRDVAAIEAVLAAHGLA